MALNAEGVPYAQKQILGPDDVHRIILRLAHDIHDRYALDESGPLDIAPDSLSLVGIRTGGAFLAERLADVLAQVRGARPPVGALDITLYRDDVLLARHPAPLVRGSEISFDLARRYVVLVDDVLFTGRTVRAALDALLDMGRPGCVRLAVLVDRGLRELPVAADLVGRTLETTLQDHVEVRLRESGAPLDEVVLGITQERRHVPREDAT